MLERLRRRKGQEGFTLIELLVVVIIIGLLAAIAIPAFLGQRNKANDAAAKSLVRNGATAMEAYFSDGNTYARRRRDQAGRDRAEHRRGQTTLSDAAQDQVKFTNLGAGTYTLASTSKSGKVFTYAKNTASTPTVARTCGSGCTW